MCVGCPGPLEKAARCHEGASASDTESIVLENPRKARLKKCRLASWIVGLLEKRFVKRTITAVTLLVVFGVLPAIIWFTAIPQPFTPRPISCSTHGGPLDAPRNSTYGDGVQSFFTIDRTTKGLAFGSAKLIDLLWDVLIARGMFFFALWVSYQAFSSSLLRALELDPIPYDTFVALSINGPTVLSTYWVFNQFWWFKRYRMKLQFFVIALGMLYVFAIPTLLTAISGYIVDTSSFATVPGTTQLLHTSEFATASAVFLNEKDSKSYCLDETSDDWKNLLRRSKLQMACCTPTDCTRQYDRDDLSSNVEWGQVCPSSEYFLKDFPTKTDWQLVSWQGSECTFHGNESFVWTDHTGTEQTSYCAQPLTAEINNQTFSAWGPLSSPHVPSPSQKCYENHAYTYDSIADNVQCLPESHPRYRWGFSTRLTSTAFLVHLIWSLTVFGLWLEAEMCGTLQREDGFQLSQLRSAFVLTKAAEATTGRCGEWLLKNPVEAKRLVSKRKSGVRFEVFSEGKAKEVAGV